MILNICTERWLKHFSEIYLPVREHAWLIASGGEGRSSTKVVYYVFETVEGVLTSENKSIRISDSFYMDLLQSWSGQKNARNQYSCQIKVD